MTTVALSGRRIDSTSGSVRFPLSARTIVENRLVEYFSELSATQLVSSAACGADLVAISAARRAGLPPKAITIVLPFLVKHFRKSSVTDRPGNWGPVYGEAIAAAQAVGTPIILDLEHSKNPYFIATQRIVEEAAYGCEPRACIVWANAARVRGWQLDEISTLPETEN